jgi:hypothetical protein
VLDPKLYTRPSSLNTKQCSFPVAIWVTNSLVGGVYSFSRRWNDDEVEATEDDDFEDGTLKLGPTPPPPPTFLLDDDDDVSRVYTFPRVVKTIQRPFVSLIETIAEGMNSLASWVLRHDKRLRRKRWEEVLERLVGRMVIESGGEPEDELGGNGPLNALKSSSLQQSSSPPPSSLPSDRLLNHR